MPVTTYSAVRNEMDRLIRAMPDGPAKDQILTTAGVPVVASGSYETVTIATGDVDVGTFLVGSGFAPPADRQNPSGGPDATRADNTPLALMLTALVNMVNEHYSSEIRPKVNAAISEINSAHGSGLSLLSP